QPHPQPEPERFTDAAGVERGQVALTQVDSVAAGEGDEVGAVVGDQGHAVIAAQRGELLERGEGCPGAAGLVAELEGGGASPQDGGGEQQQIELGAREGVHVEDGIQTAHGVTLLTMTGPAALAKALLAAALLLFA